MSGVTGNINAWHRAIAKLHELHLIPESTTPSSIRSSLKSSRNSSESEVRSKKSKSKEEKRISQDLKRLEAAQFKELLSQRRRRSSALAQEAEGAVQRSRYGVLDVNMYTQWQGENWVSLQDITASDIGKEINFRARIHQIRKISSKMVFLVLRQQTTTMQGILIEESGFVTAHMVHWVERLQIESIVTVKGLVQAPKTPVIGSSIHDSEIKIQKIHLVTKLTEPLPFKVHEADAVFTHSRKNSTSDGACDNDTSIHQIPDRVRMTNRIIDLRTSASQSIFRINSGICNAFRTFLDSKGFIEIHTPKLQAGATESGATVFEVNYFGRPAFLAQSPQLAKQMSMACDFGRVYEVGPVFRAENSNTHRHMTEFTGMDLEMTIYEHYHEALHIIDGVFKNIFKSVYERFGKEIELVKKYYPHEDLVWLEETPVIPFNDGIKMLIDSGWLEEDGQPPKYEDMSTRTEFRLGQLVKEKYKTDFYILDKFPVDARPFYTMPDPDNPAQTNSFDIFIRGQEVVSGGQRIHDAHMLAERMAKVGVAKEGMEEYMRAFEWGAPPHAGCGIGLERVVFLLLALGDIRNASLFPRDPKSLPARPKHIELPHPEADTLKFRIPTMALENPTDENLYPSLGDLIANYGDASNTSWLDDRYKVWRDSDTGAAVGWAPKHSFAVIIGNPLCDESQYYPVMKSFLKYLTTQKLKPVWLLVGEAAETVLAEKLGWSSFSCIAEERVADPGHNPAEKDQAVARKVRHAQKEGVVIINVPQNEMISEEVKAKIEIRMKDWLANRKGQQVHLTQLNPWRDASHRRYFYATDAGGVICALVVLAKLSPAHGWQVKYALDFPGAPSGTIEYITLHAMSKIAETGVKTLTFGAAAVGSFTPQHNMKGTKVKFLASTYGTITKRLRLLEKGEFRGKLGASEDPLFICYPRNGLGAGGIRAIIDFMQE